MILSQDILRRIDQLQNKQNAVETVAKEFDIPVNMVKHLTTVRLPPKEFVLSKEMLLSGGWLNRINLALSTNLPNEIDWALHHLIKLSYSQNFFIGFIPGLPDSLFDHLNLLFSKFTLNTNPSFFQTTLVDNNLPEMQHIVMLTSLDSQILVQRSLQILLVFRNLSLLNENASAFSRDHKMLTIIAKGLALPSTSYYLEIKHSVLDLFENISRLMVLRGPSDFYLACLQQMIFSYDKGLMVAAIKILQRLISNDQNEKILLQLQAPVIQRLLQLLLVNDDDIANSILEFFYLFTSISDAAARIASCVRFNVLDILVRFMYWKNPDPPKLAKLQLPPSLLRPGVDRRTVDHYLAAMWYFVLNCRLQRSYEPIIQKSVNMSEVYLEYESYCKSINIAPIQSRELSVLIPRVFSKAAINQNHVQGLTSKPNDLVTVDELRGIPLCALLVIRNIARIPECRPLFYDYESDLVQLYAKPQYCLLVGNILVELNK
jgi:hypothetical protein